MGLGAHSFHFRCRVWVLGFRVQLRFGGLEFRVSSLRLRMGVGWVLALLAVGACLCRVLALRCHTRMSRSKRLLHPYRTSTGISRPQKPFKTRVSMPHHHSIIDLHHTKTYPRKSS